jgi:hypothetical protein
LIETLRERRRGGELTIGTKAEPTNYQVERQLAGDAKYIEFLRRSRMTEAERKEADELLKELGLI